MLEGRRKVLDGWLERHGRDAVQTMGLTQREQVLGFGCEGVHPRLGHGLAPVDAVVVAEGADLRAPRGIGGPHGLGERGVEVFGQAVYFRDGGVPGLRLPEPTLHLAGRAEKVRSPRGERRVGLVLLLRLAARLRSARDPRSHDHLEYAGRQPAGTPGSATGSRP